MASVNVKRCDRCGRFCADEESFATVAIITAPADPAEKIGKREIDLCPPCERGLVVYIEGGELGREWKKRAAVTP